MSQFSRRLKIEIEGPSRPFLDSLSKQLREKVLQIAKNNNRTFEEAETLYKYIKCFNFFEKYLHLELNVEEEGLIYLCKMLRFRVLRPRELVFKEGDPSNGRCYFVFSGEVLVVKEQMDEIIRENIKKTQLKKIASTTTNKKTDHHYVSLLQHSQEALKLLMNTNKGSNAPAESKASTPVSQKAPHLGNPNPTHSRRDSLNTPLSAFKRRDSVKLESSPFKNRHDNDSNPGSPRHSKDADAKNNKKSALAFDDGDISFEPDDEYGYIKDRITWGGYFGERAMTENSKRGATIVAARSSEVLWFHYEDFKFVRKKYDRQKRMLLKFLTDIFPSLDAIKDDDVKEALIYVMDEKSYDKGKVIVQQDESSENFYVVLEGEFEISKEYEVEQNALIVDPKRSTSLPLFNQKAPRIEKFRLCELGRGMIFGEEIMINDTESYEYTVTVSSTKGTVLIFDKRKFLMRFPKEVYDDVLSMFNRKKKDYMDIVERELGRRNIKSELKRVGNNVKLKLTQAPFKKDANPKGLQEREKLKKKFIDFRNGDYTGGDMIMKKELMFNTRPRQDIDEPESYFDFMSPRDVRVPPKNNIHVNKLQEFKNKLKLNLEKMHANNNSNNPSTSFYKEKSTNVSTKKLMNMSQTERFSPASRIESRRSPRIQHNETMKSQHPESVTLITPFPPDSARMESPKGIMRSWEEIQREITTREQKASEYDHYDPKNLKDIDQFRLFPKAPEVQNPGANTYTRAQQSLKSLNGRNLRESSRVDRSPHVATFHNLDHMMEGVGHNHYGLGSPTSYGWVGTKIDLDEGQPDLGLLEVLTQRIAYATPQYKSRNESIDLDKRKKFVNIHMEMKSREIYRDSGSYSSIMKGMKDRTYSRNSEESLKLTKIFQPRLKKKGSNLLNLELGDVKRVNDLLLINPLSSRSER